MRLPSGDHVGKKSLWCSADTELGDEVGRETGARVGVSVGMGVFVVGVGDGVAAVWTAAVTSISSGLSPHALVATVIVTMTTNQYNVNFRILPIFTPLYLIDNRGGIVFF